MFQYIIIGIIISVVVNVLLIKIRLLIELVRNRNRIENTPIPDERPYHVPDFAQNRPHTPPTIPIGSVQTTTGNSPRRNGPPPELPRRQERVRRGPDTFPKCPVCRCSNKNGKQQVVFWNQQTNQWRCHRGHVFDS